MAHMEEPEYSLSPLCVVDNTLPVTGDAVCFTYMRGSSCTCCSDVTFGNFQDMLLALDIELALMSIETHPEYCTLSPSAFDAVDLVWLVLHVAPRVYA